MSPRARPASPGFARGVLLLPVVVAGVLLALVSFGKPALGDLEALNLQLGRAVLEELQRDESVREGDDPGSLIVVALGAQGLLAGTATNTPQESADDWVIGHVLLNGAAPTFPDGIYELRFASSGSIVDLLDALGQVVASAPVEQPLGTLNELSWERAFLSIARVMARRLRRL